jgi:hypothetical protein
MTNANVRLKMESTLGILKWANLFSEKYCTA